MLRRFARRAIHSRGMTDRIVIVGAGSQGAIVADILECAGTPAIGFVDDTPGKANVLGTIDDLRSIPHDAIIVAIGDNRLRRGLVERLAGERLATAIHPFTSIAASACIGEGSMISAGAIVQPNAVIGRSVILNTKASVDHDSVIADFAHISLGATLGAKVHVGAETLIAAGATIVTGMTVGARSVIGAGALVVRDIAADVTAFGVPARVRS
jgi:sugar O-acyltransferase (sialic acid O-acetyltransferase NeuD family)